MLGNDIPLVSVVIPTYGRADLLNRAIDSVLMQTYGNIEIIVVNDNKFTSEHYDPTMIALQKYTNNPKIKVVSDGENVGGSLARNKGINASAGEYISFLDDDDYYYPEKIKKQLDYLVSKNADICICYMDILKNKKIIRDNRSKSLASDIKEFLLYGNCYTPMILCKRNSLFSVGLFTDTPKFQDHVLMLKIFQKEMKVVTLREFLFVHNDHNEERITYTIKSLKGYEIRKNVEKKSLHLLNDYEMAIYRFQSEKLKFLMAKNSSNFKRNFKNILKLILISRRFKDFKISLILLIKLSINR